VRHVTGLAPASGTTVAFPETKTLDSPDHYTVGWIAALFIERAAATACSTSATTNRKAFRST